MTITFTLNPAFTGATYVAGPYDISGTTCPGNTYLLASGVTKNQLTTGHTINTGYENLTGGTISSQGVCAGTTQAWSTGIVCPYVNLEVYAKDLDNSPANATINYTINGGSSVDLVTSSPLSTNCSLIGIITGLSLNDIVLIASTQTYAMSGVNSSTCPNSIGSSTTYSHTIGVSSGIDYVGLAIDSSQSI